MILVGNQRGGARDLARHLMKDENERVIIHDLRGFVADDLDGALLESHAISKGTKCKQHLYSLSLNPPSDAEVSPEEFEAAVDRAEDTLGLAGQPRAIVFHEKIGRDGALRRHAHAVWSRIDAEHMRAVPISHDHRKLNDLARALYLEHDWQMPRGFLRQEDTNPRNYSLEEWQQAKRARKDPKRLKAVFQDCWATSDGQAAFSGALRERGYILARGDRRGFVAVDRDGEVYAISRWVGIKAKQMRSRISDTNNLPNTGAAHAEAAQIVTDRLHELQAEVAERARTTMRDAVLKRRQLAAKHQLAFDRLTAHQLDRQAAEDQVRSGRIRKGLRGLIDYLTGRRRRVEAQNRIEALKGEKRDRAERTDLASEQKELRRSLITDARDAKARHQALLKELAEDIFGLKKKAADQTNKLDRIKQQRRKRGSERPRRRRSRDGPAR